MLNLLKNMNKILVITLISTFLLCGCRSNNTSKYIYIPSASPTSNIVSFTQPQPTPEPTESEEHIQEITDEVQETANTIFNGTITVAIDAGHQAKGNNEQEPIGPNSTTTKDKVSSGTQGISTGEPEYQLTLSLSLKLHDELISRGYNVCMIRCTNNVNISNKERAKIATKANADIFVRIHADGSENQAVSGILTISPSQRNPFISELYEDSYRLAKNILDEMILETNAKDRGVSQVDNMSGINWSTIPVTIVEVGLMTNPTEDALMQTEEYQEKLVIGMANGIDKYFEKNIQENSTR